MTFSCAATPAAEPAAIVAATQTPPHTRKTWTARDAARRTALTILHALALALALHGTPVSAQSADRTDPFAARTWHFEADASAALEAWNYNGSHEELYGLGEGVTYGLRDGVLVGVHQRVLYVSQRANDSYVLGFTFGFRVRVGRHGRTSGFLEGDIGVSDAAIAAPPHGTRFNYLAIGSGGALVRLRPRVHVLAGLQVVHVSNASLKGPGRNPDIEAIGPRFGLVFRF